MMAETGAGVKHFLASVLLPQYETAFLAAGYDTPSRCANLSDAVLQQIGVLPVGHRKRILSHLPSFCNLTGPEVDNVDDDDREVYDVPPPVRVKAQQPQDAAYTNIEFSDAVKPVLPLKKQMSVEEVNIKLGITSTSQLGPSLDPLAAAAAAAAGDSNNVGCGRTHPKMCIVHPEKRPPVPLPRPVSESQSVDKLPADLEVDIVISATRPQPKPRLTRMINLPSVGEGDLESDRGKSKTGGSDVETCSNKVRNGETVVVVSEGSKSDTDLAQKQRNNSSSYCIDVAPHNFQQLVQWTTATTTTTTTTTNKSLNSGLELELEQIITQTKKSALSSSTSNEFPPKNVTSSADGSKEVRRPSAGSMCGLEKLQSPPSAGSMCGLEKLQSPPLQSQSPVTVPVVSQPAVVWKPSVPRRPSVTQQPDNFSDVPTLSQNPLAVPQQAAICKPSPFISQHSSDSQQQQLSLSSLSQMVSQNASQPTVVNRPAIPQRPPVSQLATISSSVSCESSHSVSPPQTNTTTDDVYSLEKPIDEIATTPCNIYSVSSSQDAAAAYVYDESPALFSVPGNSVPSPIKLTTCIPDGNGVGGVYEDMDRVVSSITSTPQPLLMDISDSMFDALGSTSPSSSFSYPSPGFDPPPLPQPQPVASTPSTDKHSKQLLDMNASLNASRTNYENVNITRDSFIDFMHERATRPEVQPLPVMHEATAAANDFLLSPVAAGFAKELDDYFSNKNNLSPTQWFTDSTASFGSSTMTSPSLPVASPSSNTGLLIDLGPEYNTFPPTGISTDSLEYVIEPPSSGSSSSSQPSLPSRAISTRSNAGSPSSNVAISPASIYNDSVANSCSTSVASSCGANSAVSTDINRKHVGSDRTDNSRTSVAVVVPNDYDAVAESLAKVAAIAAARNTVRSTDGVPYRQSTVPVAHRQPPQLPRLPQVTNRELRGYLSKVATGLRSELVKRWCVMTNNVLSCYESDKSVVAKETYECQDMIGVNIVIDNRYVNTFELRTLRRGPLNIRCVMFSADNCGECNMWINVLAKNMAATVHCGDIWQPFGELQRGGCAFVRTAVSADWQRRWIHLCGKKLYIFTSRSLQVEEIDLRKTKAIRYLLQSTDRCPGVPDDTSSPFAIDTHNNRTVSFQADVRQETESWFSTLRTVMTEAGNSLSAQPLTSDDVPIIVDKCINFVTVQGMEVEGIYRLSGQHSKVTQLLKQCQDDARSVIIRPEEFQVHDVANVVKRFFRTIDEPLLTTVLYDKWIVAAGLKDQKSKLEAYKSCLSQLPAVNYATVKRLIIHLARVAEKCSSNKMSIVNLASLFGPIMFKLDSEGQPPSDYGKTNLEICIAKDFLENHHWLFEVKDKELEQEKKMEEALRRIERLNVNCAESPLVPSTNLLMGVYIMAADGQVVSIKVPPSMTADELVSCLLEKVPLCSGKFEWAVFEVVANKELERPLHWSDNVLQMTLKWSNWPLDVRRDNCLCLKRNTVYENMSFAFNSTETLYCELSYAALGKKVFRRNCFEFNCGLITMRRDTRATNVIATWNSPDIVVYVGIQQQRNPPTAFGFTFYDKSDKLSGSYLGHCICCNNELELYQWLSAIIHSQYPEGLKHTQHDNDMSESDVCCKKPASSNVAVFNHWPESQPNGDTASGGGASGGGANGGGASGGGARIRNLTSKFQKLVKRDK